MRDILIVGCGDIGRRIARRSGAEGAAVAAVVRDPQKAETLKKERIETFVQDLNVPVTQRLPIAGRDLFYFVPPPGGGHTDPRVRHLLRSISPGEEPASILYVSTSGVYGEETETPLSEEACVRPITARAKRRLDAEEALCGWGRDRGVPVTILRVCAIYGPGRLPLVHIRQGHPLLSESEARPTSRIHAEDLARICLAVTGRNEVFNVSDSEPTTMTRYFEAVADAFGMPRPPQISRAEARQVMKPLLFTYFTESRQLNNDKLINSIGGDLLYPTLEKGLAASREPLA